MKTTKPKTKPVDKLEKLLAKKVAKNKPQPSWEPPASEIADIKEKCAFIALSVTRLLPTAIYIGEWFTIQKAKCDHGLWEGWVEQRFPETGQSTIRMYMQLADHKGLLEEHFDRNLSLPTPKTLPKSRSKTLPKTLPESLADSDIDLASVEPEKLPTIKEARAFIADLNKHAKAADKKTGKKAKRAKKRGPVNTLNDDNVAIVRQFFEQQIQPFVANFPASDTKAVWDWLGSLCYGSMDDNQQNNGAEPEPEE